MSEAIVSFPRRFQIWLYSVSHGQLLLRSNRSGEFSTRIDVLFKNVAAIELPTAFDGLSRKPQQMRRATKIFNLACGESRTERYLLSGGSTLGATSLQVLFFGTRMKATILIRVISKGP